MKYIKQANQTMIIIVVWLMIFLTACSYSSKPLPLLGDPVYKKVKTKTGFKIDTLYPVIPPFHFVDQENRIVTDETFRNKVYVADFIFLSCPTICPRLTASMKTIYDHYADVKDLLFISYSIDPKHDTPERLKTYGQALSISTSRWHFVTGDKEQVYQLAIKGFYSPAYPDKENPGNFVHSGGLMLVDRNGHLRGVYDGTSEEESGQLLKDISKLLKESKSNR